MAEDLTTKQEAQKFEAPKDERTIENIGQLKDLLDRAYADHFLLLHQTTANLAPRVAKDNFHLPDGTSLALTPEEIAVILPQLDLFTEDRTKSTHRGASGAVIITFPREMIAGTSFLTMQINDKLVDLKNAGLLPDPSMPNRLTLGYYADGKFHINPNFDARVPESWKNLPKDKIEVASPEDIDDKPVEKVLSDAPDNISESSNSTNEFPKDTPLPPAPTDEPFIP